MKIAASLLLCILPAAVLADLEAHIFDVGGGHCTLTKTDDGHFMVYDAGVGLAVRDNHLCARRIDAEMPPGAEIDLMILSHSDSDHISSAAELLRRRSVKQVVRTGHVRDTGVWCDMDYVIKTRIGGGIEPSDSELDERMEVCDQTATPVWVWNNSPAPTPKSIDFNLQYFPITPGQDAIQLGTSAGAPTVSLLFGLHKTPEAWDADFPSCCRVSRQRNAISIIAKLEHEGHSVLFTGDSVGLPDGTGLSDSDIREECIATERALIESEDVGDISLKSNILIAPHHGSGNGSCLEFIQRVDPDQVIFPAGHDHHHPAFATARRYFLAGIDQCDMLRTDRGDDEGTGEWFGPAKVNGETDQESDDDVVITINSGGAIAEYVQRLGTVIDCPTW